MRSPKFMKHARPVSRADKQRIAKMDKISMDVHRERWERNETAYIDIPGTNIQIQIRWPEGHSIEENDITYSRGEDKFVSFNIVG